MPGVAHQLHIGVENVEVLRAVVVVVGDVFGQKAQQIIHQLTEVLIRLYRVETMRNHGSAHKTKCNSFN